MIDSRILFTRYNSSELQWLSSDRFSLVNATQLQTNQLKAETCAVLMWMHESMSVTADDAYHQDLITWRQADSGGEREPTGRTTLGSS